MSYATIDDFNAALPEVATEDIDPAIIEKNLAEASALIDTYLQGQYKLPLVAPYHPSIVNACVKIAAYNVMVFRGFRPDEYDSNFRLQYEDIMGTPGKKGWLVLLSEGQVRLPAGSDSSSRNEGAPQIGSASNSGAYCHSHTRRGW